MESPFSEGKHVQHMRQRTPVEVICRILNNVDPLASLNGITATGGRLIVRRCSHTERI